MNPADRVRAETLGALLKRFSQEVRPLPGAAIDVARDSLVHQLIESLNRVEQIRRIGEQRPDPRWQDPSDPLFDPVKAAHLFRQAGDVDEAAWLVFLSTHFGLHRRRGWELTRRVYGALGAPPAWTWTRTSADLDGFRRWFADSAHRLADVPFGNPRQYESVRPDAKNNLADTVASYIRWIGANRGFELMVADAAALGGADPKLLFGQLYQSMQVLQFGRTAKFDYLTMIGNLSIAEIEPPVPYLVGASPPLRGARLLFAGDAQADVATAILTNAVVELGAALGLGMQVMEDSLCNWQKSQSPTKRQGRDEGGRQPSLRSR
jgi:hypothetical protein